MFINISCKYGLVWWFYFNHSMQYKLTICYIWIPDYFFANLIQYFFRSNVTLNIQKSFINNWLIWIATESFYSLLNHLATESFWHHHWRLYYFKITDSYKPPMYLFSYFVPFPMRLLDKGRKYFNPVDVLWIYTYTIIFQKIEVWIIKEYNIFFIRLPSNILNKHN